mgnify:CR=1 FL=1|jgi:hypothetical protein
MTLDINKNYEIKLNGHVLLFNLKHFYGNNKEAILLFTEVITRLNVKPEENTHLGEKPKYSDPVFIIVNALIHENLYLDGLLRLGHINNRDIRDKYVENIKEISNLDRFKRKYEILALDRVDIYGYQNKKHLNATSDVLNINIPLININREKSIPNRNIFTLGLYEIPDTILDDIITHYNDKDYSDDVSVYPVTGFFNKIKMTNILDLAIIYSLQKSLYTIDTYYTDNKIVDVYFYNNRPYSKSDMTLYIDGKNLINLQPNILTADMVKRKLRLLESKYENEVASKLHLGDIDNFIDKQDSIELSIYGEKYTYLKTRPIRVNDGEKVYEVLTDSGAHRYYKPTIDELKIFNKFNNGLVSDMEQLLLSLNLDSANIVDKVNG